MNNMPSSKTMSNRRFLIFLCGIIFFFCTILAGLSRRSDSVMAYSATPIHHVTVEDSTLKGDAIMGKLGNETLKAELGRAAWKLFHTTMARFPDTPTDDEQTALFSYIHLFGRLYPCGECAGHFRQILNRFPPQVKTRSSAAAWACHVHNEVNKSLKKLSFDCSNIGDFYDCGCAEDGNEGEKNGNGKVGQIGHSELEAPIELKLEKEGSTLGG